MSYRRQKTPYSYFEEVNNRLSWRDILSRCGIRVKKRQNNSVLIILCPFHDEKTPSLRLNEFYSVYACCGCGESGDKFDFIVKLLDKDKSFCKDKARAYHWFKKNFNIPLPWEKSNGQYIYR